MTKTEFVNKLCASVAATGATALAEQNRVYYTEYIDGEIAKGRTEEEVLEELGAPELIANSIKEANGLKDRFVDDDSKTYNAYDTPDGDPTTFAQGFEYHGKSNADEGNTGNVGDDGIKQAAAKVKTKLIIALIIGVLIIIGIIVLLVAVIGGIFSLFGVVLIPIIAAYVLYRLIKAIIKR